jgi:hypothetical protein
MQKQNLAPVGAEALKFSGSKTKITERSITCTPLSTGWSLVRFHTPPGWSGKLARLLKGHPTHRILSLSREDAPPDVPVLLTKFTLRRDFLLLIFAQLGHQLA